MTAALAAKNLARWYDQVIAVSDISLELGPGIVGLVGPNGAGKSTLMKMLVGQLKPSRGQVRILGRDPHTDRGALRHIGYCPEHERAYDELTGLEFVAALTELHGFSPSEARDRARKMLQRLDLESALDRRIGEYSKGMRQRAKLAQALAHEPEVLLLDEPLTGCDPLARVRVLEVLREASKAGRTIVISSHVLHEIESLTSQILLIDKGRVLAEGDVQAIRALIDKHPHKVRVGCADPRKLASALVALSHIARISFPRDEAQVLELETKTPDALYGELPKLARAAGLRIESLSSPDDNITAVFHYLTRDERITPEEALEAGRT
jgi:ABC-2 type transport system ATP-binding protein